MRHDVRKTDMAGDFSRRTMMNMNLPLLYRAALRGVFGKRTEFSRGSITDALFVYLDGEPESGSVDEVAARFRNRPLVCLTDAWEKWIGAQYPDAAVFRRTAMKPACRFTIPDTLAVPEEYRLERMDEAAFETHPFSHGRNYDSWAAFKAEGSGGCGVPRRSGCGFRFFVYQPGRRS